MDQAVHVGNVLMLSGYIKPLDIASIYSTQTSAPPSVCIQTSFHSAASGLVHARRKKAAGKGK